MGEWSNGHTAATTGGDVTISDPLSRRRFLQGALLAGGLALGGCSGVGLGDTLARIREAGVVRVGFAGERPYAFENEDGLLLGATVAVHRAVFRLLGDIDVEGVPTQFGELIEGLNAGSFDAVAAGMFVTADRCGRAAFSDPVYCAPQALLVPAGNPAGLRDYASVARAGLVLAVLAGGVEEDYARAAGVPSERIVRVGSQDEGLERVAAGAAAAFTLTGVSLRALLEQRRAEPIPPGAPVARPVDRVAVTAPFTPVIDGVPQLGCGAAAFRRTDESLRAAFNRELRALRAGGRVLELMGQYGFTAAEMPAPDVTTEQLCRTGGVTGAELDPLPR